MNSATRCWNKMQPNFELKLQKGATADFTYKVVEIIHIFRVLVFT